MAAPTHSKEGMKNEELEYDSYVDIKVHKSLEKFHFAQVPLEQLAPAVWDAS